MTYLERYNSCINGLRSNWKARQTMKIDDTTPPLVYPSIKEGEFYLFQTEIRFDKLLCLDGTLYTAGSDKDWAMVFYSFDEAKGYAEDRVRENPEISFVIQNHNKKPVLTIKDEAHVKEVRKRAFGVGRKKWWHLF